MACGTRTIYTSGKHDGLAAINIYDYGDRIIANVEEDKATFLQAKKRLLQEYPNLNFVQTFQKGSMGTIFMRGEK